MVRLVDFIEQSNDAKCADQLYDLLEKVLLSECGYDRVVFSLMSDHKSLRLKAGHGIMRNYPDDWMTHYIEHGYESFDPVRRFGFRQVGPFLWDVLPLVMDLARKQRLCLDQGREAGLHDGAAICLRGIIGEVAGIGVASSVKLGRASEKEAKHRLCLVNAVSHQFYVAFCSLHKRDIDLAGTQVVLTDREMEVMRYMAMAKSNSEMSDILKVSEHCIDFHVRNILQKFGVSNRLLAVLKAVSAGVLNPDEGVFTRKTG
jgi:DNA-binding CsgD family transcriptional regulator